VETKNSSLNVNSDRPSEASTAAGTTKSE